ncbi:MAG: hypothetical protein ACRCYZ_05720 [Alphaproteobacteria bacterium]
MGPKRVQENSLCRKTKKGLERCGNSRLFDPLAEDDGIVFPVEEVEMGDDILIEDTSDLGGEDEVVEVIDHRNEDNA